MIHVKRCRENPKIAIYTKKNKKSLDGKTKLTRSEAELEKAIEFFTNPIHYKNDKKIAVKEFIFKVYKDKELEKELLTYFNYKCAYCESKIDITSPWDVEHFRPKSEISTGDKKLQPGYYWLGADWNNLLISCQYCNRLQNQNDVELDRKVIAGKHSFFPLSCEEKRIRSHIGNIDDEEPYRLLLNPCIDDPEEFLTYDEKAVTKSKGSDADKAKKSIDAYGLWRNGLVDARNMVLIDFRNKIVELIELIELCDDCIERGEDHHLKGNLKKINRKVNDLLDLMKPDRPYIGMLRDYIIKGKKEEELKVLIAFGINLEDWINPKK